MGRPVCLSVLIRRLIVVPQLPKNCVLWLLAIHGFADPNRQHFVSETHRAVKANPVTGKIGWL